MPLADEILSRLASLRILVVGDLMLDHYLWGEVSRISPEAPVPIVQVARESDTAGGAANVALNLAALGVKTELIGCLGADQPGGRLQAILAAKAVDTARCVVRASVDTIVKTRVIARNQQLCRLDREGTRTGYAILPDAALAALLEEAVIAADAVIVSDYAKGVVTQELLDLLLALGRKHGRLIAVDPKPQRPLAWRGAGVLTPNRAEALELAGCPGPAGEGVTLDEIVARIAERHAPELLVITLGAQGMAVCRGGKVQQVMPTRAREVFDVSGAGDTVIATLVAALAAGADALVAAELANVAAGIVISKLGTATVTPEELAARRTPRG